MKNGFLLFCTTLLLATASPGYSAFLPASKMLSLPAKVSGKSDVQPLASVAFTTFQSGHAAHKQQHLGFWKRLKMKVLRQLLADGNNTQIIALLLGIFLGLFGVHRFYLGYNGEGAAYLSISLFAILFGLSGLFMFIFLPPLGALLIGMSVIFLSGLSIWLIVDLIRIAAGTLQPVK